jgi:hypothetical protein
MSWLGGFVDEWARQDKLEIDRIDKIDRKLSTLIPIIKEDKVKKREVERQAENASNFFEDRLSGVLEGKERDAFLNAVKNDPAKAIKIYQEIVEAEKREGYAKVTVENLFTTIERDGDLAILNTGYGAKAFIEQAEFDRRVTKIPGFLEIFNRFYDEDGKYIGIQ